MPVYVVWDSQFAPDEIREGRAVTEAIWSDMPAFDGYLGHELIEDLDDPGHLLVVSQWTTREDADASLRQYTNHPNAQRVKALVSRPRTRFVGQSVTRA
jgi:quinol monooxygenase YgiN